MTGVLALVGVLVVVVVVQGLSMRRMRTSIEALEDRMNAQDWSVRAFASVLNADLQIDRILTDGHPNRTGRRSPNGVPIVRSS